MADLQLRKKTNQLQLLISTLYRSSFGSKVQNASFLAEIHYQKLHLFVVDFLGKKNDLNNRKTTFAANLNAIYFGI